MLSRRLWRGVLTVLYLAVIPFTLHAGDELEIRITHGVESALPIAVVPFLYTGQRAALEDIAAVVRADLARSGRFVPMPPGDLPARPAALSEINFKDWRVVGMDNLVIGNITDAPDGSLLIKFRVIDVFTERQLAGFQIPANDMNIRTTAHHIADIVYETLLREQGAFATRIAYVTVERRDAKNAVYRLQVADADGFGASTILESRQPIMSPAWAPDGARIAYVSFEERNSAIYVQNIASGQREKVVSGRGINSSPAFSPDGRRLAVTRSHEGNPNIYVVDLASREMRRVTQHPAIDTEAAWAPDGRSVLFTSDRGGSPQIYRVDVSGGRPHRVTFNMGDYNARARFSPDGRAIVMVNGGEQGYRIAILDLERRSHRLLTTARLDESPSFAPNGTMVIYATMGRYGTELAAVSVDGRIKHRLALQEGEVREPAWGPFRHK